MDICQAFFCISVDNYFLDTVDGCAIMRPMASQKKDIHFTEYWPFLKEEAKKRNWTDSHFMAVCKIPRQRYYEFGKSRSLTGTYMVRLMEGMGLTNETIEKKSGLKFSAEQIKGLRQESWVAAHEDLINGLIEHPELIPLVRQQIELQNNK